jgi:hypothetical protein
VARIRSREGIRGSVILEEASFGLVLEIVGFRPLPKIDGLAKSEPSRKRA